MCVCRRISLIRNCEKLPAQEHFIVQEYLDKPFLMEGYKFDLRIYILVTSCDPLRVFLYNDGLVRMGTEKYHTPNESNLVRELHEPDVSLNIKTSPWVPALPATAPSIACRSDSVTHCLTHKSAAWQSEINEESFTPWLHKQSSNWGGCERLRQVWETLRFLLVIGPKAPRKGQTADTEYARFNGKLAEPLSLRCTEWGLMYRQWWKCNVWCPFSSRKESAVHAPDKLLGEQTQRKLRTRRDCRQREQEVHRMVHRVPPHQRLWCGQILGRCFCKCSLTSHRKYSCFVTTWSLVTLLGLPWIIIRHKLSLCAGVFHTM